MMKKEVYHHTRDTLRVANFVYVRGKVICWIVLSVGGRRTRKIEPSFPAARKFISMTLKVTVLGAGAPHGRVP
jgi:hypothetical protein